MKNTVKRALINTLPVMAGYIVLGIGFGIITVKNGYGILCAASMSLFIYAGSMQYVAISLLTSGASLATSAITALMVNARHLFYGISMIQPYGKTGQLKPYLIFALTDETYSLICTEDDSAADFKSYTFCVSLLNHCYWIAGSLIGALIGTVIPFNSTGIDFAMTALFVTVFVEQWKSSKNHFPAVAGVVISVVCLIIFGADRFLIPSMLLIAAALCISCSKNTVQEESK